MKKPFKNIIFALCISLLPASTGNTQMVDENVTMEAPILRVARPSDDLEALKNFYVDGLGMEIIDQFKSHDCFEDIFIQP